MSGFAKFEKVRKSLVSGLKIIVNFELEYEKSLKNTDKFCTVLTHAGLSAAVFAHLLLHVHVLDRVRGLPVGPTLYFLFVTVGGFRMLWLQ